MKHQPLSALCSPKLLRRAGLLAGGSLLLAVALVSYLFGAADGFFGRVFGAFFVFFWLLSVTFLAVVPFIGWATANWFGLAEPLPLAPPVRKPRPAPATVRKPTRTVTRSEKPHNL